MMRINKDLVDALMMLSGITLVLVGTSDFDNVIMKDATMGVLAVIAVVMVVLRVIEARQSAKEVTSES